MARPKAKAPAIRYHISGQSVVTIDGRDYYLGPHDSPESLARYAVLIQTYQAGGLRLPSDFDVRSIDCLVASILGQTVAPQQQSNQPITVKHVTSAFRHFAQKRYSADSKDVYRINQVCEQLEKSDGDMLASNFLVGNFVILDLPELVTKNRTS